MTEPIGIETAPGPIWRELGAPLVAGAAGGPLAGLRIAVKDLFAVAGHRIGAGNPQYLAGAPVEREHAAALRQLLGAGASVRGIAQTDEFAYSIAGRNLHYGTPPNAAVPGALPGGSSSGPAAAVAAGLADIGLATDTAGSIRVPASYQGLWGLRTTHDAVSRVGLLPLAPSFDTVGWLARDAATLAAVARVALPAVDPSVRASRQPERPPATAIDERLLALAEPAVARAFAEAVARAVAAGVLAAPERVELGDPSELFAAFRTMQSAEAWASDGAWVAAHPGALGPDIAARFAAAAALGPGEVAGARLAIAAARSRIDAALDDRILLLPSAPGAAPAADASAETIDAVRTATLQLTVVAGITGRPALSVPALRIPDARVPGGAPVGLGLLGTRGSDLALIELAVAAFGAA